MKELEEELAGLVEIEEKLKTQECEVDSELLTLETFMASKSKEELAFFGQGI